MPTTFNTTDYAIYLPAVTSEYAGRVTQVVDPQRPFPKGLQLSDLAFWEKKNLLFYHPYVLHSVGQYQVGSVIDNSITRGGRTDRILIGDSGGFQIGKGTLKGYKQLKKGMTADAALEAWVGADEVRNWIVTWLETNCQYAMTLDMPLWAATDSGLDSPFHSCSIQQLTDITVDNLRYIKMHRQEKAKWLNVIQGIDEQTTKDWFDAVKWFRYGGWALAGAAGVRGGLELALKTILMMRDDDAFCDGQDWIHVLGTSKLEWAIALTAIQKALRKTNPKLKISFDSSSPFQIGGRDEEACFMGGLDDHVSSWKIKREQSPQGHVFVGSKDPFPYASSIGNKITLGDLNVYKGLYQKRRYDPISNAMLTNHNVYVYLNAVEMANNCAFSSDPDKLFPRLYEQCIDAIFEAFDRPNWYSYIESQKSLFNAHSVSAYS
jgi:hypothetical protein